VLVINKRKRFPRLSYYFPKLREEIRGIFEPQSFSHDMEFALDFKVFQDDGHPVCVFFVMHRPTGLTVPPYALLIYCKNIVKTVHKSLKANSKNKS